MQVNKDDHLSKLVILFIVVIVLWLAVGVGVYFAFDNMEHRGQFGDLFGAANSLFSGLALAGVVFAIFLQRKDLALQRAELRMSRDQLKRTADTQEKAERTRIQQANTMYITAKIEAYNAILEYYSDRAEISAGDMNLSRDELMEYKKYHEKLKTLVEDLDNNPNGEITQNDNID
ncbi:MAG TPA: hypothetical protein VK004_06440 [Ignavibacteria bacterium]|nr:hypothetical protein [Ignavibacteria bacterium]